MARENYYLLLELDPDLDTSWAAIEPKFNVKWNEWSQLSITHPTRKNEYKQYLNQVPDLVRVLKDDVLRLAEADEARTLKPKNQEVSRHLLEDLVSLVGIKGYLIAKDVDVLVAHGRGVWTQADVAAIAGNLKIEIHNASPKPEAVERPRIDNVETIHRTLADLDKVDLYDFLGVSRTSSVRMLKDLADRKYQELRSLPKTHLVEVSQELVGHCLNLFTSDEQRTRYDNAVQWLKFDEIRTLTDLAGRGEGKLAVQVTEALLLRGAKDGLAKESVAEAIREVAVRLRFLVEMPLGGRSDGLIQRCGWCGELASDTDTHCPGKRCGRPLKLECPNCSTLNPTHARACGNARCHFALGDIFFAERALRDAKGLIQSDPDRAKQHVKEAFEFWPSHPEGVRLLGMVARRRADAIVQRALALEIQGKLDEMITAFTEALQVCVDHPEARAGLSRWPPDPPSAAGSKADTTRVNIAWQSSPACGRVTYRVVRKAHGVPTSSTDGDVIGEGNTTTIADVTAEPGVFYYYAIYTIRTGVASTRAAVTGPVFRVAGVTNLRATAGDGRVTLEWQPPPDAARIEVWRQPGSPPPSGQGHQLNVVTRKSATDSALSNGNTYGYRVVAIFNGPGGTSMRGLEVTCTVRPEEPPRPVSNLVGSVHRSRFLASWTPPPNGTVQIYVSDDGRAPAPGLVLPVDELDSIGKPVPLISHDTAQGELGERRQILLVPVTISGTMGVIGEPVWVSGVADVEVEQLELHDGRLLARWTWPAGINQAVVAFRPDKFPAGPEDRDATCISVQRLQDQSQGQLDHLIPAHVDRLHVAVFSVLIDGKLRAYGPAATQESRKVLEVGRRRKVKFRVVFKPRFLPWQKPVPLALELTPNAETPLPELLLVAREGTRPLKPEQGFQVLRTGAVKYCSPHEPARYALTFGTVGSSCGVSMFPADPRDAEWLELISEAPLGYSIYLPRRAQLFNNGYDGFPL